MRRAVVLAAVVATCFSVGAFIDPPWVVPPRTGLLGAILHIPLWPALFVVVMIGIPFVGPHDIQPSQYYVAAVLTWLFIFAGVLGWCLARLRKRLANKADVP
jgi:hypothetical protein